MQQNTTLLKYYDPSIDLSKYCKMNATTENKINVARGTTYAPISYATETGCQIAKEHVLFCLFNSL